LFDIELVYVVREVTDNLYSPEYETSSKEKKLNYNLTLKMHIDSNNNIINHNLINHNIIITI